MMFDVSDEYAKYCEDISKDMWAYSLDQAGVDKAFEQMILKVKRAIDEIEKPDDLNNMPRGDSETYRAISLLYTDLHVLKKQFDKIHTQYIAYESLLHMIGSNESVSTDEIDNVLSLRTW